MTRAELLEMIVNGESSRVEFKRDEVRPAQLAREVAALANADGGHVLLGVEDDGAVSGIQRENLEHWVMDTVFGQYVHPMITPAYEEVQVDDKRVAVVTVTQGVSKPYVVRERNRQDAYVRVGSTSRLATREQLARLYAVGGMLRPDVLPVSGSGLEDLSRARLIDYLTAVMGADDVPTDDDGWHDRLQELDFMTAPREGRPVCTVAGLVLFGRSPRRFLRQAGIRWMAFEGEDMEYEALDDRHIDGPLVALRRVGAGGRKEIVENGLIENVVQAMRPFVTEESGEVDESLRRERRWLYPLEAVRETIVNAAAHRDWTRQEDLDVVRYSDRLEVVSPGALPNGMTVKKMIAGNRLARNRVIMDTLRDYEYVDARGMGVRKKVIPLLRQFSGQGPRFEVTEDYVKVVMSAARRDTNSGD